ncbi:anti-sigma factor [Pseudarthrobacter sp. J75]|uniref:anti-sigma factor n=1 Tax=unclassified Pseudarthrobacter TaxID=2647000 RepID=UPI002E81F010|nr:MULTISPECIES: anti-sigma factor [unclassified Pseudarthrobacter]MEE2524576.1 anti-sigma factor [Pseudarthrobacter sp. J47]MEE2527595.1 anti-sigma factor [Pseudarthrobacter sp. J75]
MTSMNTNDGGRGSRAFATDIATDLKAGRAVELAEIYALDAVSDDEREAIDAYISAAPQAERDAFNERVRTARETLALSFTVEEEPPAGLLERTLAQLPEAPPQSGTQAPGDVPASGDELQAARQKREERRRPSAARRWLIGAVAAAALVLGGLGIGSYVATQNDPVNQVLQAQDVREATVDVTGGGTATVAVSASKDAVVVRMKDVPPPPAGKVYQMWLIPEDGSAPVSQGLMDAEALSKPAVVNGISSASALGITVEPDGGSESPTLPTVAAAPLDT